MTKRVTYELWDYASPGDRRRRGTYDDVDEANEAYDFHQTTAGGDHRVIKVTRKEIRG